MFYGGKKCGTPSLSPMGFPSGGCARVYDFVYIVWTSWLRGHPCRFSLWLRAILLNIHWLLSLLGGHGIELLFSLFWCWLGIFLILPCMHCLLFFFGCGGWIYRVLCAGSLFGVYPIFWFLVGKGPPDLTTIGLWDHFQGTKLCTPTLGGERGRSRGKKQEGEEGGRERKEISREREGSYLQLRKKCPKSLSDKSLILR